jgi:hypothetical protein
MCPMCIATAALMIVGTASTGSLTAFVLKKFRPMNVPDKTRSLDSERRKDLATRSHTHEKEQS